MYKNLISDARIIEFEPKGDSRGELVVVEGERDIPFCIKRVFYIYGTQENVVRGQHANKRTDFCLINLQGECKVRVVDYTGDKKIVVLDQPNMGLFLPKGLWKEMYDFSSDSILLVMCSEVYDTDEYIRDIDQYFAEGV